MDARFRQVLTTEGRPGPGRLLLPKGAGLALSAALHLAVFAALGAHHSPAPDMEPALVVELVAEPPKVEPPPPAPLPVAKPTPTPAPTPIPTISPRVAAPAAKPSPLPPAIAARPADIPAPESAEPAPAAAAIAAATPRIVEEEPYVPPSSHADYLSNPPPRYPSVATRRGWQGTVVLEVEVDERGEPVSVRVESSSGHGILDEAALATVRKWRFVPASRGGRPVAAAVKVPVRFNLAEG